MSKIVSQIDCGRHARARIWIDELPSTPSLDVAERRFSCHVPQRLARERKAVAVEILWPTGARSLYGLLGAEFIPAATTDLSVSVQFEADQSRVSDF